MKKLLLLPFTIIVYFVSFSQNIPNRDFENWVIDTLYENTNEWSTTLDEFYSPVILTIEKSTDAQHGDFSVLLSNDTIWNEDDGKLDTTFGYALQGVFGDDGPEEGIAYTTDFDSITGWYKNEMVGNDSALIVVSKFSATDTTFDAFTIGGTNTDWTRFSFPVSSVIGTLEEVLVAFVSTDADIIGNGIVFHPESWVMFDNIAFTSISSTPDPIPEYSFEDWSPASYEEPEDWFTFNYYSFVSGEELQVTKTTDAYSGDYAIKITSEHLDLGGNDTIGLILNSEIDDNLPGGFAIDEVPLSISGYYKYNPISNDDTAAGAVFLSKWNATGDSTDEVDVQFFQLVAQSNYTPFSFDFDTAGIDTSMFDSVNIVFTTSQDAFDGAAPQGSELFIDDIWLDSKCAFTDTTELWFVDSLTVSNIFGDYEMPGQYESYLWSSGDTSKITFFNCYEYITSGIEVTDNEGCLISDSLVIYMDCEMSVNDSWSNLVPIYPNPTTSTINIDLSNADGSLEKEITISNLLGKQILSTFVQAERQEINMSEYPKGVYLIKIRIGEELATVKVVKK